MNSAYPNSSNTEFGPWLIAQRRYLRNNAGNSKPRNSSRESGGSNRFSIFEDNDKETIIPTNKEATTKSNPNSQEVIVFTSKENKLKLNTDKSDAKRGRKGSLGSNTTTLAPAHGNSIGHRNFPSEPGQTSMKWSHTSTSKPTQALSLVTQPTLTKRTKPPLTRSPPLPLSQPLPDTQPTPSASGVPVSTKTALTPDINSNLSSPPHLNDPTNDSMEEDIDEHTDMEIGSVEKPVLPAQQGFSDIHEID